MTPAEILAALPYVTELLLKGAPEVASLIEHLRLKGIGDAELAKQKEYIEEIDPRAIVEGQNG